MSSRPSGDSPEFLRAEAPVTPRSLQVDGELRWQGRLDNLTTSEYTRLTTLLDAGTVIADDEATELGGFLERARVTAPSAS